jgi:hypothetical protein
MQRIGVLSDTHGFIEPIIFEKLRECDQIWHAGDIGSMKVVGAIENGLNKPFKAVHGNIDDNIVRSIFPKHLRFFCESVDVWITHIGGYPKKYDSTVKSEILNNPPNIFISGHSHILKVMYDEDLDLLHINPGAAGKSGIHTVKTAVLFSIDGDRIENLEVIEAER